MDSKRIKVYGRDADNREKRAFDLVLSDGQLYVETVNREGHRIMTPAKIVLSKYRQLRTKTIDT